MMAPFPHTPASTNTGSGGAGGTYQVLDPTWGAGETAVIIHICAHGALKMLPQKSKN